ncbi:MAG TPA: hypothetical protein VIJ42_07625 [Stellaceae bacterium]
MTEVLTLPVLDPARSRIALTLPPGMTVEAIIDAALPGLPAAARGRCRVVLADGDRMAVAAPEYWRTLRPKAGVRVIIRIVPGKGALGSILQIVVAIAAVAIGPLAGPLIATALGFTSATAASIAGAVAAATVGIVGSLLLNALIGPRAQAAQAPTFSITGWQNQANPGGVLPEVFGTHRVAPVFAAPSYTEIVGDVQYLRALFIWSAGPVAISDLWIGENTPIAKYDDIQIETRLGYPDDDPVTLYPNQPIEEPLNVELTRPRPRGPAGFILPGGVPVDTPEVR